MTPTRRQFTAMTLGLPVALTTTRSGWALGRRPLVIARGAASGDFPEATRGAYELAIREGADFIAASFMPTSDNRLVARPEAELSTTTDVAAHAQFADRKRSRAVDGTPRSGWFTQDFTLAELKTLTCGPLTPRRRGGPPPPRAILTFEEVVAIARAGSVKTARVVGLEATMLHPAYFASQDLAIEPLLAAAIQVAGYDAKAAAMLVASSEPAALKTIGGLISARRVRLVGAEEKDAVTAESLAEIHGYADAVALDPGLLLNLTAVKTTPPTQTIALARAAGLAVQAWIARDAAFPPPPFHHSDARRVLLALFRSGVDAVCGDLAGPLEKARAEAFAPPPVRPPMM